MGEWAGKGTFAIFICQCEGENISSVLESQLSIWFISESLKRDRNLFHCSNALLQGSFHFLFLLQSIENDFPLFGKTGK